MTGSVTFTPSEADYVGAIRANFVAALRRRPVWLRIAITTAIFVPVGAGVGWLFGTVRSAVIGGSAGLGYALFPHAVIFGLSYLLLPRRAGRLFRQQRSIHQRFDYLWSVDGLEWTSNQGSGRYPWGELHGWRESQSAFLIYMNDTLFQFLPRRALDDARANDLRTTLERSGLPIY